jgi:protein phosphatase inhibitor 2
MKITEPKTPYAKRYNPLEDEAELRILDAEDLVVDELDAMQAEAGEGPSSMPKRKKKEYAMPDEDIPGLELGEPEEAVPENSLKARESHSPKQVVVKDDYIGDHHHRHGDDDEGLDTPEEEEKHRKFQEMRRRHYEMKEVANLLGHPEELDEEDDDGDVQLGDAPNGVPHAPMVPVGLANGTSV